MLYKQSQVFLDPLYLGLLYAGLMSIGKRLEQLRTSKSLTQEQIGEICGVTKGMVSQWELDIVTPPTGRLLKLHERINFSFDWLLNGDTVYSTTNQKIGAALTVMEQSADYVQDAAVQAVLTTCELAKRAKANGTHG